MKHRSLYPTNWDELASACKEAAGWCCQFCGIAQGTQVVSQYTGVVYPIRLGAAHLDHDPWNPTPRLAALCQSCHMRYDYSWQERQRWLALEEYRHHVMVNGYLAQSSEE
jgi:hypothetical protein